MICCKKPFSQSKLPAGNVGTREQNQTQPPLRDQPAMAGSTGENSAPKQSGQLVGPVCGVHRIGPLGRPTGGTNSVGWSCRWSRIMTLRAPTLEATISDRPHPFLSTRRGRPLSRNVRLWLPKTLSSTTDPHRAAKSTIMSNPNIPHGIIPLRETIISNSTIQTSRISQIIVPSNTL